MLVLAGLAFFVPRSTAPSQPVAAWPTGSTTPTGRGTPSAVVPSGGTSPSSAAASRSGCRAGEPARLVMPSLGVDAPFERIGLDTSLPRDANGRAPLGNPKDRTRAGWYASGPRPGSGTGTVLTNGHTYRDGSAIFKEDFARRIAVGQLVHVKQRNGSVCSYRVSRVWREVDAARGYPALVTSQRLYDFAGPERLLVVTCGGSWNAVADDYDDVSVLIADPVDRA